MSKRFSKSVCALVCFCALSLNCKAQANPWDGSWKIEPSTFKYSGPTFSVATDSDGFTTTRGGEAQPKVVCDGKPHDSPGSSMTACTKTGAGYALDTSKDGKRIRKTTISVSDDGKTRTVKSEIFPPDGDPFTITTISKRLSGGPGPGGEWKEASFSSSTDSGILTIAVKGDMVDFKETDSLKPVSCKLDGTETKTGGGTMSVTLADAHTLKVTYKDDSGKVRRGNTFALSEDGKSITETDLTPAPSESTMTVVLGKM